ncbi:hypothetical protein N9164_03985 [Draconibacterium sp.]|nr:hypothetical protein [Draconibacterium sp.]
MKNYLSIILTVLLLTGISCQQKIDIEKEKEEIKKAIWNGTNAWKAKSLEQISATYVHDDNVFRLGAGKNGYIITEGWSEIENMYKTYFEDYPEPIDTEYQKLNFRIKLYKNYAWAIHDEIAETATGEENKLKIVHFLEKQDSKWKVILISLLDISSYEGIEGTWNLVSTKSIENGETWVDIPKKNPGDAIKIWTSSHFSATGKAVLNNEEINYHSGGTYTLVGNKYTENVKYHYYQEYRNESINMTIEIKNDTLVQTYPVDADGNFDKNNYTVEKYVRLD